MFGDLINFTSDLSNWDVSNVTDMGNMFFDAPSLPVTYLASNVSNVTICTVCSEKQVLLILTYRFGMFLTLWVECSEKQVLLMNRNVS